MNLHDFYLKIADRQWLMDSEPGDFHDAALAACIMEEVDGLLDSISEGYADEAAQQGAMDDVLMLLDRLAADVAIYEVPA